MLPILVVAGLGVGAVGLPVAAILAWGAIPQPASRRITALAVAGAILVGPVALVTATWLGGGCSGAPSSGRSSSTSASRWRCSQRCSSPCRTPSRRSWPIVEPSWDG